MKKTHRFGIYYGQMQDLIEIRIKSFNGKLLESYTFPGKDKKRYSSVLRNIKEKYGYSPEIKPAESVKEQEERRVKAIEETGFFDS